MNHFLLFVVLALIPTFDFEISFTKTVAHEIKIKRFDYCRTITIHPFHFLLYISYSIQLSKKESEISFLFALAGVSVSSSEGDNAGEKGARIQGRY